MLILRLNNRWTTVEIESSFRASSELTIMLCAHSKTRGLAIRTWSQFFDAQFDYELVKLRLANLQLPILQSDSSDFLSFLSGEKIGNDFGKKKKKMSHVRSKTTVLSPRNYIPVVHHGDHRRNQFAIFKGRSQDIVQRIEHRFHEVNLSNSRTSVQLSFRCWSMLPERRNI